MGDWVEPSRRKVPKDFKLRLHTTDSSGEADKQSDSDIRLNLSEDDLTRISQVERAAGLTAEDVLTAALRGDTTSAGEPGQEIQGVGDLRFLGRSGMQGKIIIGGMK